MTMNVAQGERLKKALAKERYAARKGDLVAVAIKHSSTALPGSVAKSDVYTTYHLAQVARASRQGRVELIQLYGHGASTRRAYDYPFTELRVISTKQDAARALAATLTHADANVFASIDHLRAAILAYDKREESEP